jgi:hypothetical protein
MVSREATRNIAAVLIVAVVAGAAQHHHAAVNERGKVVMGFDQEKTVHHFHLYTDGGAIDVRVRDATNTLNLEAIRSHLPHIAAMFSQGNFEAPMLRDWEGRLSKTPAGAEGRDAACFGPSTQWRQSPIESSIHDSNPQSTIRNPQSDGLSNRAA